MPKDRDAFKSVLAQLLKPVAEVLTPDVAQKITAIRASAEVQARIDELADKCTEGELTPEEAAEYDSYVHAMDLIDVFKAQARPVLEGPAGAFKQEPAVMRKSRVFFIRYGSKNRQINRNRSPAFSGLTP